MRNTSINFLVGVAISFIIGCASASPQAAPSADLQKYETTTFPKFEMNDLCRYYIVSVRDTLPSLDGTYPADRGVFLRHFASPITQCSIATDQSFVEVNDAQFGGHVARWFSAIETNIEAIEAAFNTIETVICKLDRATYYNSLEQIMVERGEIGTSVISLSFDSTICSRTVPVTRMNTFAGYGITLRYVPDFEILSVGPGIP